MNKTLKTVLIVLALIVIVIILIYSFQSKAQRVIVNPQASDIGQCNQKCEYNMNVCKEICLPTDSTCLNDCTVQHQQCDDSCNTSGGRDQKVYCCDLDPKTKCPDAEPSGGVCTLLAEGGSCLPGATACYYKQPRAGEFSCGDLLVDPRDNQSYPTVLIGTQCWMAKNLNVGTMLCSGSQGASTCAEGDTDNGIVEKYCYNNTPTNCDTYGSLYQWHTAMNLPQSCDSSDCSGQISVTHQGICPVGWHMPSDFEWTTLTNYIGAGTGTCMSEGGVLRSAVGWDGTNTSGFSALPAGIRNYINNGLFQNLGGYADFWSSTPWPTNQTMAIYRELFTQSSAKTICRYAQSSSRGHSVRCVQDSL